jgi:site-specific recombinase XerD
MSTAPVHGVLNPDGPSIPVAEAIQRCLVALRAEGCSACTVAAYRSALRRLERLALQEEATMTADLEPQLVKRAMVEVMQEGADGLARKPAANHKGGREMARMIAYSARSLSRVMQDEGVRIADMRKVHAPKRAKRIQPRVLPGEFRALEDAIERRRDYPRFSRFQLLRDEALIRVLMDTGLRAFEVSRLDIGDVDLKRGVLTVRGKGSKDRALGICDAADAEGGPALRALRAYLQVRKQFLERHQQTSEPALWLGWQRRQRMSPDALRDVLQRLCEEAGIQGNRPVHAFRRGYFTESYRRDPRDLAVLIARMGWSTRSQELIDTYTRGATLTFAEEPRNSLGKQLSTEGTSTAPVMPTATPPPAPVVVPPAVISREALVEELQRRVAELDQQLAGAEQRIAELERLLANANVVPAPAVVPAQLDEATVERWLHEDQQWRPAHLNQSVMLVSRAAELLRIDESTLQRWIAEGRLQGSGTMGTRSVRLASLRALASQITAPWSDGSGIEVGEPIDVLDAAALCGIDRPGWDGHYWIERWIRDGRLSVDLTADGHYLLARSEVLTLARLAWRWVATDRARAIVNHLDPNQRRSLPAWVQTFHQPNAVELVEQRVRPRPCLRPRQQPYTVEAEARAIVEGLDL